MENGHSDSLIACDNSTTTGQTATKNPDSSGPDHDPVDTSRMQPVEPSLLTATDNNSSQSTILFTQETPNKIPSPSLYNRCANTSNSYHHQLPQLVNSGLPFISPSGYSAPVNLINPVADPQLITGYPSATLVPNPHLATYAHPSPVGPLVIRPTGLSPYVPTNLLPGNSPTADLQGAPHTTVSTQPMQFMAAAPEMAPPQDDLSNSVVSSHQPLKQPSPNLQTAPVSGETGSNAEMMDPGSGEYYVMVHVDAGATFSVRVGDQIQHIPGPATVRMVSNSGPPIPMPMQVPAGHLVQQIVDEEGILKHVILSLYPGPTPPATSAQTGINGRPGTSVIVDPSQQQFHHRHHHHTPSERGVPAFGTQYAHTHAPHPHLHPPAFVAHHPGHLPHFHSPMPPFMASPMVRPEFKTSEAPNGFLMTTDNSSNQHEPVESSASPPEEQSVKTKGTKLETRIVPDNDLNSGTLDAKDSTRRANKDSAGMDNTAASKQVSSTTPVNSTDNQENDTLLGDSKSPTRGASFAAVAAMNSRSTLKDPNNRTSDTPTDSRASDSDARLTTPTNGHSSSSSRRRGRAGKTTTSSRATNHAPPASKSNASTVSNGRHDTDWPECNGTLHNGGRRNAVGPAWSYKAGRRSQTQNYLPDTADPTGTDVYLPDMMLDEGDGQGTESSNWEPEAIHAALSTIQSPQVSDVKAHSALIHLNLPEDLTVRVGPDVSSPHRQPPNKDPTQPLDTTWSLDENAVQFELHLAERDCSTRFNCVFAGEASDISLQDLRPGSDYFVKFCCVYGEVRGQFSNAVRFTTLSTEPSAPRNLTVVGHTRNSLQLKWNASSDNGSRILSYCVEYAPAITRDQFSMVSDHSQSEDFIPNFVEGYRGLARTCKLTQLAPSTTYLLRVMAQNSHGVGPWSSVVAGSTSGSPPPTPPTPYLVTADIHSLTLAWHPLNPHRPNGKRPLDVSYTLEMDDEAMGHGFVTVFDGMGLEHCVENLRRNTRYRFRLAAANVDGRSRWTEIVVFSTLPDRPSAPQNLRVTGPVTSNRVTFTWDSPADDGGLPIRCYNLELRLPNHPEEFADRGDDSSRHYSPEASLLCVPNVKGLPGKTTFACGRPMNSQCASGDSVIPPKLASTSSTDLTTDFSDGTLCCHRCASGKSYCDASSAADPICTHNDGDYADRESHEFRWFVVYEGVGDTVTVSNLPPGLRLYCRVRAVTTSDESSGKILWGVTSSPPLTLVIPPLAPFAPSGPPRLVGQPKSTWLRLSWKPPRNDGGSPIVSYELLQTEVFSMLKDDDDADSSPPPTSESDSDDFELPSFPCKSRRSRSVDLLPDVSQCPCSTSLAQGKSAAGPILHTISEPECSVTNLRPGHSYAFRVRACNLVGRGPWSPSVTLSTMACPPATPKKAPCVFPVSPTEIKLTWEPVRRANGASVKEYRLEWMHEPGNSDRFQLVYSGPNLSFEFTGAQPARTLAFRYCAVNSAGPGQWSPVGTCVTPSTTPSQPSALQVVSHEASATRIQWDFPTPNGFPITSFQLELSELCTDSERVVDIPAGGQAPLASVQTPIVQHVFNDLKPDVAYRVRVRAMNFLGYGPYSAPLVFNTLPLPPSAPSFGTPTQLSATSVRLQWHGTEDRTQSSSTRFQLQSSLDPDCDWSTIFEGPDSVFKVARLAENTTYYFRVQAVNIAGPGDWSDSIQVTTLRLPPPTVRGLKLSEITTDGCQLEWSPVACPGADPILYVVHVLPLTAQNTPISSQTQVYRSSLTSCRITDLTVNTEYVCRVCAIRLCPPSDVPLTFSEDDAADSVSSETASDCTSTNNSFCIRKLLTGSAYQVTELPGPFSHSVQFTTRPLKSFKSNAESSAPSVSPTLDAAIKKTLFQRFCTLFSSSTRKSNRDLNSSSWRRRILATQSMSASAKSPSSPTKRHSNGFRLSDRKLAFLFLLLFGLITFLVSWSLQCFLTVQPSPSISVMPSSSAGPAPTGHSDLEL